MMEALLDIELQGTKVPRTADPAHDIVRVLTILVGQMRISLPVMYILQQIIATCRKNHTKKLMQRLLKDFR